MTSKYSIVKALILSLALILGTVKSNDIKVSYGSNGLINKMGEEITLLYENNNRMKSKTGRLARDVVKLKYPDRGSEMEFNLLNITIIKTMLPISIGLRKNV